MENNLINPSYWAKNHRDEIITSDELKKLKAAIADIQKQSKIADEHSPTIQHMREREAADAYAQDPTEANMTKLRHVKTLDASEHARVQQIAEMRQRAAVKGLTSLAITVCGKTAKIVRVHLDEQEKIESERAKFFGISFVPSVTAEALRQAESELIAVTRCNPEIGLSAIPELLTAIAKQN